MYNACTNKGYFARSDITFDHTWMHMSIKPRCVQERYCICMCTFFKEILDNAMVLWHGIMVLAWYMSNKAIIYILIYNIIYKHCCYHATKMAILSYYNLNTNPHTEQTVSVTTLSLSLIAGREIQPRFRLRSSPLSSMMTHHSCFSLGKHSLFSLQI